MTYGSTTYREHSVIFFFLCPLPPASHLALRPTQLALGPSQLALRPSQLALRPSQLAGWGDGQTEKMEKICGDALGHCPLRGRCPKTEKIPEQWNFTPKDFMGSAKFLPYIGILLKPI